MRFQFFTVAPALSLTTLSIVTFAIPLLALHSLRLGSLCFIASF